MPPRPSLRWAAVGLLCLLAVGAFWSRPPAELRETRLVFGTLVEIVIRDADTARAQGALVEAGHLMQRLHRDWHAWQHGALSAINAELRAGADAETTTEITQLLRMAQQLACLSSGTFDPAIGQLVDLWGFHSDTPTGIVPNPKQVADIQATAPRMADLRIADGVVRSTNPAVRIDLGGLGKGAALDAVAELLRERGLSQAILNAGGDVNVMGVHGDRPWRVAIRDPFAWGAVASVEMAADEVLYTSGNYERFFEQAGVRFAHILDPRTGYPVQDIVSASVLHQSGAYADAAATALTVAGPSEWAQVAADMGLRHAMLITDEGRVLASPDMAARLVFEDDTFQAALEIQELPPPRNLGCEGDPDLRMSAL